MIIFATDDPLVLNGTYDQEGYTPKERRAQERRAQQRRGEQMTKKKATVGKRAKKKPAARKPDVTLTDDKGRVMVSGTDAEFKQAARKAGSHRLTTHTPSVPNRPPLGSTASKNGVMR